jgi:hypothetical protein
MYLILMYQTFFLYVAAKEYRLQNHTRLTNTHVHSSCQLRATVQCEDVVQTHFVYANEYGRLYKTQSLEVSIHA